MTEIVLDDNDEQLPRDLTRLRSRVMYVEDKSEGDDGPARFGRVYFSRSGRTLYYGGKKFRSLNGQGICGNYVDVSTGDEYWITGVKKRGGNRLYGGNRGVEIDEDVVEELRDYFA